MLKRSAIGLISLLCFTLVAITSFANDLFIYPTKNQSAEQQDKWECRAWAVTLKGPDGSIETIMVVNPDDLDHIKIGDQVVITRAEALALSVEKEG